MPCGAVELSCYPDDQKACMYCVSPARFQAGGTFRSQLPRLLHSPVEGVGICLAIEAEFGKVRRGEWPAGCAGDVDVTTLSLPLS